MKNCNKLIKVYVSDKKREYFASLYRAHSKDLYHYGVSLGFTPEICLDAIHDLFCKFYTREYNVDPKEIAFYLFRSFKNQLLDIQKSKKKEVAIADINNLPFHVKVTVVDNLIEEEERIRIKEKVERLMELLTSRQREAVYLRYMKEMEYEEIGKLLDMNAESVRKLVFRGIEKIRQQCGIMSLFFLLCVLASCN